MEIEHLKEELKKIKAKDIMSRFAITTTDDKSLREVADLVMRFKISGLPVVSRQGSVVGIITATDLFRIMGETVKDLSSDAASCQHKDIRVEDVMTEEVVTAEEDATLQDMISLMCAKNIHTLPILKHGKLIGVVGRRDVLYKYYSIISRT